MVRSGDLMLAALARLLHAVHEGDTLADERQEVRAVEASPAPLRHVEELVGHQQSFRARACALRHALAQPHGRKRRLDHVGRAEMLPVSPECESASKHPSDSAQCGESGEDRAPRNTRRDVGILVPPGDHAALADALASLLSSSGARAALACRARLQASRHSWDATAGQLEAVCKRLV